jgi:hypothetical protein
MIRFAPFLGSLALLACAAPEVAPEIGQASALLAETDKGVRPTLEPIAAAELAAAEDAAMQTGDTVLALDGTCNFAEARDAGNAVTDCVLVEFARPDKGPVNATTVLDALETMDNYFVALAALASSESSDEVAARSAALVDALGQLNQGNRSPALARIAGAATERKDLLVRTAGFLASRYRVAALRKVVRRADPVLGRLVLIAAAYLDQGPDGMPAAQMRLEDAEEEVALASGSGDVARHRRAVAELRAAFASFKAVEASSPANRLYLLRQFHAELLERLSGPQSAEEFLTTIEEIKAIADLANQGDDDGN